MYEVDFSQLGDMVNDWIKDIWDDRNRYIVCKGGGGSGKSYGICQMIVYRCIAEPGHRFLVVRKVARTIRESIFQLIQEIISSYGCSSLFKVNKTDMTISCINGNKFLFAGLDDVEKLKSIQGITDVVIEECSELEPGDRNQLDIRLRGPSRYPKQMFLMFNPISITHWLKAEYFDRRKPNATVIETTYKDNRYLDSENIALLESFRETDEYYYMVYCLGMWGVTSKTVFPAKIVSERLVYLKEHDPVIKRGMFIYEYENEKIIDSSIQWIDDDKGYIKIFEEVQHGYPYTSGGDTAGDGSDRFVLDIMNNISGNQAAVLCHDMDEDLFVRQAYCLGRYYNNAMLAIESNFSSFSNKELYRLGYIDLYNREVIDTYTGAIEKKYGFRTDKLSRPLAIANLVKIVREHIELFNDVDLMDEMLTFVRDEKFKPVAAEGSHDDRVMAAAIKFLCRDQGRFYIIEDKIQPEHKLASKLGINNKNKKR